MTHDDQPHSDDPQRTETHDQKQPVAGRPEAYGEPHREPRIPRAIGQFHIKRVIASGGMGTVYEAMQESPRRTVAVKVMKRGIASRTALRRFEYESQTLARLHHPGIAQVYEAGTHDDGTGPVPYFAMEYIPNPKTITEYARAKKLGTRERLQLFTQACKAVYHGHQKGIIHRDLKPANILVDSHGQLKVIDFGVARATDSDMAVTTLQTDVGQLIGTVQYMSPEQCEADPHDLDTRSDVYALGVVLYELLCDKRPYDIGKVAVYEAARVIREQPPTKLSTVNRTLRGDVETIALKALEKDRERRYQSADQLRQDIECYLKGEPISARPPSVMYQLRVLTRRNKGLVGGVAAAFVVLLAGVIVSTSLYLRAEDARIVAVDARVAEARQRQSAEAAREEADQARDAEEEQRKLAEANARKARQEADKAEAVNAFLQETLASVDPLKIGLRATTGHEIRRIPLRSGRSARDAKVADLLCQASARVGQVFADEPELEAQVRRTLGMSFLGLGMFDQAEAELKRALEIRRRLFGNDHVETLRASADLGIIYHMQFRTPEAEPHLRRAVKGLGKILGEQHPDTLEAKLYLGHALSAMGGTEEGVPLLEETLGVRRNELGEEHPGTIGAMCFLSMALCFQGELSEAEVMAREARQLSRRILGPDDWYSGISKFILGLSLSAQGKHVEGEPLLREGYEDSRRILGEDHPYTGFLGSRLADNLTMQGKLEDAGEVVAALIDVARRRAERPGAGAQDIHLYALLLVTCEPADLRDPGKALPLAQRAVEMTDGTNSIMLYALARAYHQTGDLDQALSTQKKAMTMLSASNVGMLIPFHADYLVLLLEAGRDAEADLSLGMLPVTLRLMLGKQHPILPMALNFLGARLANAGYHARGIRLYREALECGRQIHGNEHRRVAMILTNLALASAAVGDYASALSAQREAVAIQRQLHGDESPQVAQDLTTLGGIQLDSGQSAEAGESYHQALELNRQLYGDQSPQVTQALQTIGRMQFDSGNFAEAGELYRQALTICRELYGGEDVRTATALHGLGTALEQLAELEEAIGALERALAIRQRVRGDADTSTLLAMNSLAWALRTTGRLDEAEALARQAVAGFVERFGRENENALTVAETLAVILHRQGKLDEAAATFADIIATCERTPARDHPDLPRFRMSYGECLIDMGRYAEAEGQLSAAHAHRQRMFGDDHKLTHDAVRAMVVLYESWGKPKQAAQWQAKLPTTQPATAPIGRDP